MASHTMAITAVKWGGDERIYTAARDCSINVWDAQVRDAQFLVTIVLSLMRKHQQGQFVLDIMQIQMGFAQSLRHITSWLDWHPTPAIISKVPCTAALWEWPSLKPVGADIWGLYIGQAHRGEL